MTKKELVKIIREVVKREIKSVLTEQNVEVTQPKKQYTKSTMLNEVLNNTAANEEWPTIDANTLRAKFAGMQDGPTPMTDINNRPVDTSKLDPSLSKALTRDYSELVKKFR